MTVPPRGSGWVPTLPIVNFQLPISVWGIDQSTIGNRQSSIGRPTRLLPRGGTDFITRDFSLMQLDQSFLKFIGHSQQD
jgi:hypothetical protein